MKPLILCRALLLSAVTHADTKPAEPPDSNEIAMPAANWLFAQVGDTFTSDGKTLTRSLCAASMLA